MAAGSRDVYALNLNDIFAFPDGDNIPLRSPNTEEGESWVMLLEVCLVSKTPYFYFVVTWLFILRKDNGHLPYYPRPDICDG
jgi:hypothetical protein